MAVSEQENLKSAYQEIRAKYEELNQLRLQASQLERECNSSVSKLTEKVFEAQKATKNKEESLELKNMSATLADMKSTFRHPPGFILSMIIGNINTTLSKSDRLEYKQDYERFKLFNVSLLLILSIISLVFYEYQLPSALVHCVSVWYYFTVILREMVLLNNGSRIKWWWLVHHYLSIVMAAVFLTWPPGPCYSFFKPQFMFFSVCLTCVMVLQFVYQRAKLYRQVAMGKSHHMVVTQESQVGIVIDFSFLVICLIGIYGFQFYNSYILYTMLFLYEDCQRWQVAVASLMFFFVAILNSWTLLSVLYSKLHNLLATGRSSSNTKKDT